MINALTLKVIFLILVIFMNNDILTLFDFSKNSNSQDWKIVNDGVMGGLSQATITNEVDGAICFKGTISLENNGGFSSVRYRFSRKDIARYTKLQIRLKGDGKRYQFRLKRSQSDQYAYISHFETSGAWQTITISLKELYPTFKGRKLEMDTYSPDYLEEIGFLIANKKTEEFKLLLSSLTLT